MQHPFADFVSPTCAYPITADFRDGRSHVRLTQCGLRPTVVLRGPYDTRIDETPMESQDFAARLAPDRPSQAKLTQHYEHVRAHTDLPRIALEQIQHFFEHYKDLERGKWVKLIGWGDVKEAKQPIRDAIRRERDGH